MTRSVGEIVRLSQNESSLFNRTPGLGQTPLIDRKLVTTRIDRFAQPLHPKIGQLLGNCLKPLADVVELPCHRPFLSPSSSGGPNVSGLM